MSLSFFLIHACKESDKKDEPTVQNYQIDKPDKFLMPESLLEISGIAFYKGRSDTVYAIQDEQGRLFRLGWGVKKQLNTKFAKQGDYEDVTIVNGKIVVLKSNGTLYIFPFDEAVYEDADSVREWKSLLPEGEYEGMYGDETTKSLYVICKNCAGDDSKHSVSGYIFQIGDSVWQTGTFAVDVKEIKTLAGKVRRGFRPSALAKNPITGDWYILSAVNKLLVVTDSNWTIRETCQLNGNTFNQPEGIAFDAEGNMYISNEGDDLSQGNILKFTRTE